MRIPLIVVAALSPLLAGMVNGEPLDTPHDRVVDCFLEELDRLSDAWDERHGLAPCDSPADDASPEELRQWRGCFSAQMDAKDATSEKPSFVNEAMALCEARELERQLADADSATAGETAEVRECAERLTRWEYGPGAADLCIRLYDRLDFCKPNDRARIARRLDAEVAERMASLRRRITEGSGEPESLDTLAADMAETRQHEAFLREIEWRARTTAERYAHCE